MYHVSVVDKSRVDPHKDDLSSLGGICATHLNKLVYLVLLAVWMRQDFPSLKVSHLGSTCFFPTKCGFFSLLDFITVRAPRLLQLLDLTGWSIA
jgi:hypothetical protein